MSVPFEFSNMAMPPGWYLQNSDRSYTMWPSKVTNRDSPSNLFLLNVEIGMGTSNLSLRAETEEEVSHNRRSISI